jgi:ELWxxDGT repeat protein
MVADIKTSEGDGSNPNELTPLGAWIYFSADNGVYGSELWRTNGTTTELVANIASGWNDSSPSGFTILGDWIYFSANDGTYGDELWRTNGNSTVRVRDINLTGNSYPYFFTSFKGWIYFKANDGVNGIELWRTDGTTTQLVKNINTRSNEESYPHSFTPLGDWLYFRADDGTHGSEMWRTNGSTTERVPFSVSGVEVSMDYSQRFSTLGGRLFTAVYSAKTGSEFAWLENPTRAQATVVPSIAGATSVGKTLSVNKGTWAGAPTPTFTYQWYTCTSSIKAARSTVPSSCRKITGANKATFRITSSQRRKYIAVLVIGTSRGTTPTQWLSKSTAAVR